MDHVPAKLFKDGPNAKLKLPGRARFPQTIFNHKFAAFLDAISLNPRRADDYIIRSSEIGLKVCYDPDQSCGSGGHLDYSQIFSLEDNVVYRALSSKVDQLLGTNFIGSLGIILCDGGCSFFNKRSVTGLSYSMDDVIKKFLYDNQSINFVVTFGIERLNPFGPLSRVDNPLKINCGYYRGLGFENMSLNLPEVLEKVLEVLPEPESSARSALSYLKKSIPNEGRSHWGGLRMSVGKKASEVRISARALLQLLAGKTKQKEFFESHHFMDSELGLTASKNPFQASLAGGQLIEDILIEKSDTEDDDWITIRLGKRDAAISPFVVP